MLKNSSKKEKTSVEIIDMDKLEKSIKFNFYILEHKDKGVSFCNPEYSINNNEKPYKYNQTTIIKFFGFCYISQDELINYSDFCKAELNKLSSWSDGITKHEQILYEALKRYLKDNILTINSKDENVEFHEDFLKQTKTKVILLDELGILDHLDKKYNLNNQAKLGEIVKELMRVDIAEIDPKNIKREINIIKQKSYSMPETQKEKIDKIFKRLKLPLTKKD